MAFGIIFGCLGILTTTECHKEAHNNYAIRRLIIIIATLVRPSDRGGLKNANYAIFSGQIVRLERPIMR